MSTLFRFPVLCVLLLALTVFGGCAGNRGQGHMFSFVADKFPSDQAATLAERMADSLSEIFPPGHTALFIQPTAKPDDLGAAFEAALRSRGFVIAPEPSDQALAVAYALDQVDEQTWYTRIAVSGGLVITRTYDLTGEQLTEGAATRTAGGDHGQR